MANWLGKGRAGAWTCLALSLSLAAMLTLTGALPPCTARAEDTASLSGYLWQVQYTDSTGLDPRVARCLVVSNSGLTSGAPPVFPLDPAYAEGFLTRLADRSLTWQVVVDGVACGEVGAAAEGYFAVGGLPAGTHSLAFELGGARSASLAVTLAPGNNLLSPRTLLADPFTGTGYSFTTVTY
ncbi:MAG: hypothetical protein ACM3RP_10645 [Chitinophagales bacterium]